MKTTTEMKTTEATTTFRFRAELYADIVALINIIPRRRLTGMQWRAHDELPDVYASIETNRMDLDDLRDFMRQVIDGHTMVETVALADEYTGERNYGI